MLFAMWTAALAQGSSGKSAAFHAALQLLSAQQPTQNTLASMLHLYRFFGPHIPPCQSGLALSFCSMAIFSSLACSMPRLQLLTHAADLDPGTPGTSISKLDLLHVQSLDMHTGASQREIAAQAAEDAAWTELQRCTAWWLGEFVNSAAGETAGQALPEVPEEEHAAKDSAGLSAAETLALKVVQSPLPQQSFMKRVHITLGDMPRACGVHALVWPGWPVWQFFCHTTLSPPAALLKDKDSVVQAAEAACRLYGVPSWPRPSRTCSTHASHLHGWSGLPARRLLPRCTFPSEQHASC